MSPNAKDTNMLVFLALGNAKELSFALVDAKVPNANDFAFWCNIGLNVKVGAWRPASFAYHNHFVCLAFIASCVCHNYCIYCLYCVSHRGVLFNHLSLH